MRRFVVVLLGAAAIVVLPLTQASAAPAGVSSRTVTHTHAQTLRLVKASAWQRISLSPRECAALKLPAGRCTASESVKLVKVAATGSTIFWSGYLQACAVVYSSGGCQTSTWWVTDNFNFTTDASTGQAWNNGTPQCAANHTNITWCSYDNNGKTNMQEGFNFGNGGYARMGLTGYGTPYDNSPCTGLQGPSWAHVLGYVYTTAINDGYTC